MAEGAHGESLGLDRVARDQWAVSLSAACEAAVADWWKGRFGWE